MKRKLAVLLLAALLLTTCMAMFCGCVDEEPEPREVELELVNPITGDIIKSGDTIDLPTEKTYIEVRIKDSKTGRYLTDNDLPENTIKDSYHVQLITLDNDGHNYFQRDYKYWPTKEELKSESYYGSYEMQMSFDCRPKNPQNPREFQRKYKMYTSYVKFHID